MYEELRKFTEQVLAACATDPDGDWLLACVAEFRDRFPAMSSVDHVRLRVMPDGVVAPMEVGPCLRDWLAVHAPAEPLWDFHAPLPPGQPEAPSLEFMSSSTREERADATWRYQRDLGEWQDARRRAKLVRWPWVWADAVLAMRGEA